MANERIAVIYCGSFMAKNLFDKLLHLNTFPILLPHTVSPQQLLALDPHAIVITGSPSYVRDPNAERIHPEIYDLGIPMLGVCYGMQLMALDLGGDVRRMAEQEREVVDLMFTENASPLYRDFADESAPVWMVHSCKVTAMPPGFTKTGETEMSEVASMQNEERGLYAVQFHPEHRGKDAANQAGTAILWSFLEEVAGCG